MALLVYGVSIRGNGHYVSGMECQDQNSFEESDFSADEIKVIAMADGHGGAPYFRSSEGAEVAVMIAKKVLHGFIEKNKGILDKITELEDKVTKSEAIEKTFIDPQDLSSIPFYPINQESHSKEEISNLQEEIKKGLSELRAEIVENWKEEIDSKLKENPVKVAEIEISFAGNSRKFTGYAEESDGCLRMITLNLNPDLIEGIKSRKHEIYGSTLIAAALYKSHTFVLQIGDGEVAFLGEDGEVSFPIPKLPEQIGNATNSLCQNDAVERFTCYYSDKPLKMIMEVSDGVSNAVDSDNKLGEVAKLIYNNFDEDPDTFRQDIKPFLRQFSEASFDDCTLCLIANVDEKAFESVKNQKECEDTSVLDALYQQPFDFLNLESEKAFIKYHIETLSGNDEIGEENQEDIKYGKITAIEKNEIYFKNMSTEEFFDSLKD